MQTLSLRQVPPFERRVVPQAFTSRVEDAIEHARIVNWLLALKAAIPPLAVYTFSHIATDLGALEFPILPTLPIAVLLTIFAAALSSIEVVSMNLKLYHVGVQAHQRALAVVRAVCVSGLFDLGVIFDPGWFGILCGLTLIGMNMTGALVELRTRELGHTRVPASAPTPEIDAQAKDPKRVAAGRKAAATRRARAKPSTGNRSAPVVAIERGTSHH